MTCKFMEQIKIHFFYLLIWSKELMTETFVLSIKCYSKYNFSRINKFKAKKKKKIRNKRDSSALCVIISRSSPRYGCQIGIIGRVIVPHILIMAC